MHERTDTTYAASRTSGVAKFLILQAVLIALGAAWATARVREQNLAAALPELRPVPLDIRPTYDYPVVVSDDQLSRVLTKLRPRNNGPKTKLNYIDHALRFWTAKAKFKDPAYFSGEQMRGILTDNRQFVALYGTQTPPLLIDAPNGVRVRMQDGLATSSHDDHTMAGLAEVGTPLDFPVVTPTHKTDYRAMVDQALLDFSLNQVEYEWSAATFALLMSSRNDWITSEGQQMNFDRIARRMMREELPRGVCFGNHRLYTLTLLLRVDAEQKILSPVVRTEITDFLIGMTAKLVQHQHVDGFWDGKWPLRPASSDVKEMSSGDLMTDRILATGHALEWWAMAPAECHPPRETLAKAGQWMVRTVENLTPEQVDSYYTFLTHAGRSLALWRGKLPNEVTLLE